MVIAIYIFYEYFFGENSEGFSSNIAGKEAVSTAERLQSTFSSGNVWQERRKREKATFTHERQSVDTTIAFYGKGT